MGLEKCLLGIKHERICKNGIIANDHIMKALGWQKKFKLKRIYCLKPIYSH